MKFKILKETAMSMGELKDELAKIKARDTELSFRAQKTVDYLDTVVNVTNHEAKQLFDKLTKLEVPRLKDTHIHKLIDVMPITSKDVKTVLQGYAVTVTNENLKKIADTIAETQKK